MWQGRGLFLFLLLFFFSLSSRVCVPFFPFPVSQKRKKEARCALLCIFVVLVLRLVPAPRTRERACVRCAAVLKERREKARKEGIKSARERLKKKETAITPPPPRSQLFVSVVMGARSALFCAFYCAWGLKSTRRFPALQRTVRFDELLRQKSGAEFGSKKEEGRRRIDRSIDLDLFFATSLAFLAFQLTSLSPCTLPSSTAPTHSKRPEETDR